MTAHFDNKKEGKKLIFTEQLFRSYDYIDIPK